MRFRLSYSHAKLPECFQTGSRSRTAQRAEKPFAIVPATSQLLFPSISLNGENDSCERISTQFKREIGVDSISIESVAHKEATCRISSASKKPRISARLRIEWESRTGSVDNLRS